MTNKMSLEFILNKTPEKSAKMHLSFILCDPDVSEGGLKSSTRLQKGGSFVRIETSPGSKKSGGRKSVSSLEAIGEVEESEGRRVDVRLNGFTKGPGLEGREYYNDGFRRLQYQTQTLANLILREYYGGDSDDDHDEYDEYDDGESDSFFSDSEEEEIEEEDGNPLEGNSINVDRAVASVRDISEGLVIAQELRGLLRRHAAMLGEVEDALQEHLIRVSEEAREGCIFDHFVIQTEDRDDWRNKFLDFEGEQNITDEAQMFIRPVEGAAALVGKMFSNDILHPCEFPEICRLAFGIDSDSGPISEAVIHLIYVMVRHSKSVIYARKYRPYVDMFVAFLENRIETSCSTASGRERMKDKLKKLCRMLRDYKKLENLREFLSLHIGPSLQYESD